MVLIWNLFPLICLRWMMETHYCCFLFLLVLHIIIIIIIIWVKPVNTDRCLLALVPGSHVVVWAEHPSQIQELECCSVLITSFYYDPAALLQLTAAAFLPVPARLAPSPKPQVNHVLRTRESRSDTDGSIAVCAVVALQQKMCMSPSGGQHGGFLLRAASFPVKGNEAVLARFMCRLQTFLLCAGGAALRSGGGGFPSLVWSLSTILHYFTEGFFRQHNTFSRFSR